MKVLGFCTIAQYVVEFESSIFEVLDLVVPLQGDDLTIIIVDVLKIL